jgi:hypothetical protein
MKLQFLGDSRDSFKWDLLHHVVTSTQPAFRELVFVPMLTPDVPGLGHGSTPATRYPCRPNVLKFVHSLAVKPRSFERVASLGSLPDMPSFMVHIHQPDQQLGFGWQRHFYWQRLLEQPRAESLVFIDPDNGFETNSQAGQQHLRYGEAAALLSRLPVTSALVVFQYRPQGQSWDVVFGRIGNSFPDPFQYVAIHHGQLAFVFIGRSATFQAVTSAVEAYGHSQRSLQIRRSGGA